jgi:hypothetical protein
VQQVQLPAQAAQQPLGQAAPLHPGLLLPLPMANCWPCPIAAPTALPAGYLPQASQIPHAYCSNPTVWLGMAPVPGAGLPACGSAWPLGGVNSSTGNLFTLQASGPRESVLATKGREYARASAADGVAASSQRVPGSDDFGALVTIAQAWELWEKGRNGARAVLLLEGSLDAEWHAAKQSTKLKSTVGRHKQVVESIMSWAQDHNITPAAAAVAMDREAVRLGASEKAGFHGRWRKLQPPQAVANLANTAGAGATPKTAKLVDRALREYRRTHCDLQPRALEGAMQALGESGACGTADASGALEGGPTSSVPTSLPLQGEVPPAEAALLPSGRDLEVMLCTAMEGGGRAGKRLDVKEAARQVMLSLPAAVSQAMTREVQSEYGNGKASMDGKDKTGWLSSYMLFSACKGKGMQAAQGGSLTDANVGSVWTNEVKGSNGVITRRRVVWELLAAAYSIGTGRVPHNPECGAADGESATRRAKKARKA